MSESDLVVRDRADGVLIMTINRPPVNALNADVRAALIAAIAALADDHGLLGGVLTSACDSFVAGSDIREFEGEIPQPRLPEVIAALERCPKPVVAAVNGLALGGGFELALGCDRRVGTEASEFALPEVSLGMVPGAGGTQRLPRLVGRARASEIVLSSRRVRGQEALAIGILDELVPAAELVGRATSLARRSVKRLLRNEGVADSAEPAAASVRGLDRAAPRVAAGLIDLAGRASWDEAIATERAQFDALRAGPESAALRHLFFAERAAGRGLADAAGQRPVRSAAVVGAGLMGVGIAFALASAGLDVRVCDTSDEAAARGAERFAALAGQALSRGRIDAAAAAELRSLTTWHGRLGDLSGCDLIVEAVFEDLPTKQRLMPELEAVAPHAILASNTSYLDLAAVGAELRQPSSLIGLHFFNPAHVMRLVEVVRTDLSRPTAVDAALRLIRRAGKLPLLVRNSEGFAANRLLSSYRKYAEYLLEEGNSVGEIDAAMEEFGYAMGPFAVADLSGLHVAWTRRRALRERGVVAGRYVEIPDLLYESGRTGKGAGAGYYDYPDGRRRDSDAVAALVRAESRRKGIERRPRQPAAIASLLAMAMVLEGAQLVLDGVVRHSSDVDVAAVSGLGFPSWRGGPLWWAAAQPAGWLEGQLASLSQLSGVAGPSAESVSAVLSAVFPSSHPR